MLGAAGRERRARRDPPAAAGSPVVDRIPRGACGFAPLRRRARGRAAPATGSSRTGSRSAGTSAASPRPQGAGCDVGAVEVRVDPVRTPARSPSRVGCGAGVARAGARARAPRRDGEDSPWPRTSALRPNMRAVQRVVAGSSGGRADGAVGGALRRLETCIRDVPVNEYGDRDRQFGYLYDERRRHRARLHAGARRRQEEPAAAGRTTCSSTSARRRLPQRRPAARRHRRAGVRATPAARTRRAGRPRAARSARLERRVRRCAPAQRLRDDLRALRRVGVVRLLGPGDRVRRPRRQVRLPLRARRDASGGYRPALAIDRSDWDDPDYMFLALVGGDRPGRTARTNQERRWTEMRRALTPVRASAPPGRVAPPSAMARGPARRCATGSRSSSRSWSRSPRTSRTSRSRWRSSTSSTSACT